MSTPTTVRSVCFSRASARLWARPADDSIARSRAWNATQTLNDRNAAHDRAMPIHTRVVDPPSAAAIRLKARRNRFPAGFGAEIRVIGSCEASGDDTVAPPVEE